MALKRSFLESMGLTEAQISAIMDEHIAVTDRMKKEIEQYKADADRLPEVQKELDALKGGEDYKAKYDREHQDFEDYKAQVARDADAAKVRSAYRKLLADAGISGEKRLDAICMCTDFSNMKLEKDGSLHDAEKLTESIKQDWADIIPKTIERGVPVETPPAGKSTMTKEEIMNIKDTSARQKAIAENLNLFGH